MPDLSPPQNPFMSMWMSALNQSMGAAQGFALAEIHRQITAMQIELGKQVLDFWTGAWNGGLAQSPSATPRIAKAAKTSTADQLQGTEIQADVGKQIVDFWSGAWMRPFLLARGPQSGGEGKVNGSA